MLKATPRQIFCGQMFHMVSSKYIHGRNRNEVVIQLPVGFNLRHTAISSVSGGKLVLKLPQGKFFEVKCSM